MRPTRHVMYYATAPRPERERSTDLEQKLRPLSAGLARRLRRLYNNIRILTMSNQISPSELGSFLDAVASAPVALRDVPRINSILARLVGLANSKHPIGEVVPAETSPTKYDNDAAAFMAGGTSYYDELAAGTD